MDNEREYPEYQVSGECHAEALTATVKAIETPLFYNEPVLWDCAAVEAILAWVNKIDPSYTGEIKRVGEWEFDANNGLQIARYRVERF